MIQLPHAKELIAAGITNSDITYEKQIAKIKKALEGALRSKEISYNDSVRVEFKNASMLEEVRKELTNLGYSITGGADNLFKKDQAYIINWRR